MARSRYSNVAETPNGVAVEIEPYAEVSVFVAGTSTPYVGTIYAGASGVTTKPNPFNADQYGNVEFYLDTPDDVKLEVSGVGLGTRVLDYEPVFPSPRDMLVYTNTTYAAIQATVNLGFPARLPPGITTIATKLSMPVGATIIGVGQQLSVLEWTGAVGGTMIEYTAGGFSPSHMTLMDFTLRTNITSVIGIHSNNGGFEMIHNLGFQGISMPFWFFGTFTSTIINVWFASWMTNASVGGSLFDTCSELDITSYTTYGEVLEEAVITIRRCATPYLRGLHLQGISTYTNNSIGVVVEGDTQGIVITHSVILGSHKAISFRYHSASGAPSYAVLNTILIDQYWTYGIELVKAGQVQISDSQITNSLGTPNGSGGYVAATGTGVAIIIAAYPPQPNPNPNGVQNTKIQNVMFESFGPFAIQCSANADYVQVSDCSMQRGTITPVGDAAFYLGVGTSNYIQVANTTMINVTYGIFDQASGGSNREYLDNPGVAPVISTIVGTTVRSSLQVQTNGIFLAKEIASTANPSTGYSSLYFGTDGKWHIKIGATVLDVLDSAVWTAFSPTLAQSGAPTYTVDNARYKLLGKLAVVQVQISVTAVGGAVTNNDIIITLPAALTSKFTGSFATVGTAQIYDSSIGMYVCTVFAATGTTIGFFQNGATLPIGRSPNIALAAGDKISLNLSYELA